MNHIMLDLETMGNTPTAAIASIGAVKFDLDKLELGDEFYRVIDLETISQYGLTFEGSTILWWLVQNDEARYALTGPNSGQLPEVLQHFTEWCGKDEFLVWGNGSTFDNVILKNAYKACHLSLPWSHRNDLCYRTVRRLFPLPKVEEGTQHNALDDARRQAKLLIKTVDMLRMIGDEHGDITWRSQGGKKGIIY